MDFVNPMLLGGAALAAVPIILHLVMRQKPQHLEFPALRFLKERREANRRRLRLQHLLLLALRVGALVLLATALARPSLKTTGGIVDQEAPVAAVLVFDTSARMQYRHQNRTRLEEAQETALWLLAQLPPESEVAVLDSRLGSPVFQVDLGAAKQRIERLETTAVAQSLPTVLDEAVRLLDEHAEDRKEIYLFTDLARQAWGGEAGRLGERLAAVDDLGFYVIDVGVREPQNFALGELRLSGQVVSRNTPLRITTNVSHVGSGGRRGVELYLVDEQGQPQKRDQQEVQLTSGESVPLEFPLTGLVEGTHQGFVRLVGEDNLAVDDVRYFTVEVKPVWSVLVVAPDPADEHAFYLTEALAPEQFRRNGLARFRPDVIGYGALGQAKLADYATVCLLDPPALSAGDWQRLAGYANDGGGVAVFLGRRAEPAEAFNRDATEVLPGRLAAVVAETTWMAPESTHHPLLAKFRPLEGTVPWDLFPVYRYWQVDELAEGTLVVVRYADQSPAVLERPLGRGRVLAMTTPVSDSADAGPWNLLPTGFDAWPFVMLTNEMMLYLVGSTEGELNYRAGQTARLAFDASEPVSTYVLATPRGDEFRRQADREQHAIVVTTTDWPGQYQVRSGGQAGVRRGFSVNLAPEYSALERLEADQLQGMLGEARFQLARGRQEIDRQISTGRVGRELFAILFGVVAVLLAMEYLTANRFYGDDDAVQEKQKAAAVIAAFRTGEAPPSNGAQAGGDRSGRPREKAS